MHLKRDILVSQISFFQMVNVYRYVEACEVTAGELCGGLKPGNGRLLECLLGKVESPEMGEGCKRKLRKQVVRENTNLAFNLRVKRECAAELPRLCRSDGDEEAVVKAAAEVGLALFTKLFCSQNTS